MKVTYQGKRKLYQFLVSHGYNVPKMKEMEYQFYRGSEWLRDFFHEIELYSPHAGRVCVTTYEENSEGKIVANEVCTYLEGNPIYKTIRGKCVM